MSILRYKIIYVISKLCCNISFSIIIRTCKLSGRKLVYWA
jgi:hypothetical protein